MSIDTSFEAYKEIYLNARLSIEQSLLIAEISAEMMRDFPNNLPISIKNGTNDLFSDLSKAMNLINENIETPFGDPRFPKLNVKDHTTRSMLLYIISTMIADKVETLEEGFSDIIYAQSIVMYMLILMPS